MQTNHYAINSHPRRSVLQAFPTREALRRFLAEDHLYRPIEISEKEARVEAFRSGAFWIHEGAAIPDSWQTTHRKWEVYGPVTALGDDLILVVLGK